MPVGQEDLAASGQAVTIGADSIDPVVARETAAMIDPAEVGSNDKVVAIEAADTTKVEGHSTDKVVVSAPEDMIEEEVASTNKAVVSGLVVILEGEVTSIDKAAEAAVTENLPSKEDRAFKRKIIKTWTINDDEHSLLEICSLPPPPPPNSLLQQ